MEHLSDRERMMLEKIQGKLSKSKFDTSSEALQDWKSLVSESADLKMLALYTRMIAPNTPNGAETVPFFEVVIDHALKLMSDEIDFKEVYALYEEFGDQNGTNLYVRKIAEHFGRLTPGVAFWLVKTIKHDGFGGKEAREALYQAIDPDLRVHYDIFAQAA